MEKEIWKDIPGYEGIYKLSTKGRIKSFKWNKENFLDPAVHKKYGYRITCLRKDGKQKVFTIQVLMGMTFFNIKDFTNIRIDHLDSNPTNNNIENLAPVTHRKNCSKERTIKSGLPTGVSLNKHAVKNKYSARIWYNGKNHSLGYYATPEEASIAYQNALSKHEI